MYLGADVIAAGQWHPSGFERPILSWLGQHAEPSELASNGDLYYIKSWSWI